MAVPVTVALAAVAAVVASGTAMLAGAQHGAPAGPHLVARAAPAVAPMAAPPPDPAHPDRAQLPSSVDPSGSVAAPSMTDPSAPGSAGSPSMGNPPGSASPPPVDPSAPGSAAATPSVSVSVSPSASAAVNCAEVRIRVGGAGPTDVGGQFVPFGATTVTRCETPLGGEGPVGARAPKVLTTGVDRLTAILNALPAVPADQACLPITMPVQLSLVFTFPEREPLVVIVDPTCSAVIAGERARSYTTLNPLPVFDALFGAQPRPSRPTPANSRQP